MRGTPLRVGPENGLFARRPQAVESCLDRNGGEIAASGQQLLRPNEPGCERTGSAGESHPANHIFAYFGPPPPSGGTQTMFWFGSLISQVLQWTQFCALMT